MESDVNTLVGAWAQAAYGVDGFWHRSRPGDHVATAASASPELADAPLAPLANRPEVATMVDVGAGDGALLSVLAGAGRGLDLVGVDLRPRPPALAAAVRWVQD